MYLTATGQYSEGRVVVTSGSTIVVGDSNVNWSDATIATIYPPGYIDVDDVFKIHNDRCFYKIATRVSATRLQLYQKYCGVSASGNRYIICRDFTTKRSYVQLYPGDLQVGDVIREQIVDKIDNDIGMFLGGTATLDNIRVGTTATNLHYWDVYLNASYETCFDYKGTRKAHIGTLTGSWIQP